MPTLPHDISDLHLAPVVLAVNARIDELSKLTLDELSKHIATVNDRPGRIQELREFALIFTLGHDIDLHEWELSWHPRGIRMAHRDHHLVLGAPPSFADYLAGLAGA